MSRPRIGLNCDVAADSGGEALKLGWPYVEAVLRAGGAPVLLPPVADEELLADALRVIDGLVLAGGRDYDPALYGQVRHPATRLVEERRGSFDIALARNALASGVPTLGVCGGTQLINIALGGSLLQHIPEQIGAEVAHTTVGDVKAFHLVEAADDSRLAGIVGAQRLEVNSTHHQAIDRVGRGLRVVARAPDGVVEGVEGTGDAFVLGLQWHPERMLDRPEQVALFRALVAAAQHRRKRRRAQL
jgi:putative glutamine amidotransferase